MKFIDYFQKRFHQGPCSFAEFMQAALYAPNIGYYTSGAPILGKQGDFITAPELTPLFGQALATQCEPILASLETPILFEFGAGTGRLCVDILRCLQKTNCLPEEYHILELSGHLQERQKTLIQQEVPDLFSRVKWLSSWPQTPFQGVVIANEVLDAMPVHRFLQTEQGLMESFVTLSETQQLIEIVKPCTNAALQTLVDSVLPKTLYPYLSEANLFVEGWLSQCAAMLDKGILLLIDYGFPQHEYYHPDRNQGTLMCHWRHQSHIDPFAHPGEQDITAHVDFTHVASCAQKAGFSVAGYTNQASFLINCGLLNHAISPESGSALKRLLQPTEMGELFKVIALQKHCDTPLMGFQFNDKRGSL